MEKLTAHIIHSLHDNRIVIIQFPEQVDYAYSLAIEKIIEAILAEYGNKPVVIDLNSCCYMSSSGLRLIAVIKLAAEKNSMPCAIAGGNGQILNLIGMTELDRVISIHPSLQEALEELSP